MALACVFLLTCWSASGQTAIEKLSFVYTDVPLLDVLRDINKKSGNRVMYKVEEIRKENSAVNVNLPSATLFEGVSACLRGKNLTCVERDGQIIITPVAHTATPPPPIIPVTLKGHVASHDGESLRGVTVTIRGTTQGFVTDAAGNFSYVLQQPPSSIVLVFSFVGMETQHVVYNGQELKIMMREMAADAGEVVVTGIFNKPRESYTGAVTSITRKELQTAGNRSIISSIQNIDPSFRIADDIDLGSDPNALPSITIRGNSSMDTHFRDLQSDSENRANRPLFILDGFEISLQRMMDTDPNIVESVTLLKDASATAMYGSRGANGVVVITTRKPEKGTLRLTYKGSLNIEAPDLRSYNLMNSREKLAFEKAAGLYTHENVITQEELFNLYNARLTDVLRGVDTYWLKYPVRTGVGSRHSLRIEGGAEDVSYAANLAYDNIQGAMKGSTRNNFNGNIYLAYKMGNVSFQNNLIISFNNATNSPYGSFGEYGKLNSYYIPFDKEGDPVKMLETQQRYQSLPIPIQVNSVANPLWDAMLPSLNESKYNQIQDNFEVMWDIIPQELFFKGRFGFTQMDSRGDVFISPDNTKFDNYTGSNYGRRGEYALSLGESRTYELSFSLNYSKIFNDVHQVFAGLFGEFNDNRNEYTTITAEGISNSNRKFLGAATLYKQGGKPEVTEGLTRRLGTTFNANYTYDRRYFVDAVARYEGSSLFGSDKRMAPFWSAGAGWNMHAESFMSDIETINTSRIRVSYGTSGSLNFSPYQAIATFMDYGNVHYDGWSGTYLFNMGNPDLKWQITKTINAGIDLEMFERRLTVSADVYSKITNDAISDITIPSSSGFKSYTANIGEVRNRGVELGITAVLIRIPESGWRWSVGGTLAHNKNKIMKISNSLKALNDELLKNDGVNPSFLLQEGQSMNTIFAVRSLGIDPANGKELFVDRFGEITYTWSAADKIACGIAEPKIWGNLNTSLMWKKLTLTAIFGYKYGGKAYNSTLANKLENIAPYENADRRAYYDRWKTVGEHASFKSVADFTTTYASTRFVMKDNSFNCSSITLQYELQSDWLRRNMSVSNFAVSGYMEDVFRITSIRQERGLSYPFSRKYSLALTLRF